MAATALLRLAAVTGRDDFERVGRETLQAARAVLEQSPMAAGQSLVALDFLVRGPREFVVVAGAQDEMVAALEVIAESFLPSKVVVPNPNPAAAPVVPLLADRPVVNGLVTTYICENQTCAAPVEGFEALRTAMAGS
jgi:uncharacterized protein YyaL (SSP411 family)